MAIKELLFLLIITDVNGFIVQEPTQNASIHDMYTQLKLEIANLDRKYSNLQTDYANIKTDNANMENEINNLTQSYRNLQNDLNILTAESNELKQEQQNVTLQLESVHNTTVHLLSVYQLQAKQISQLGNQFSYLNGKFEHLPTNHGGTSPSYLGNQTSTNGTTNGSKRIGFSVSLPARETIGRDGPLKFTNAFYNDDDAFNFTLAMFVCEIPGLYFFSATIIRDTGGYTESFCYLMINGHARAYLGAYSYQGAHGYPSGTATIIYHMDEGDTAYVGMCGVIQQIGGYSHFNGFLIQAD